MLTEYTSMSNRSDNFIYFFNKIKLVVGIACGNSTHVLHARFFALLLQGQGWGDVKGGVGLSRSTSYLEIILVNLSPARSPMCG